MRMSRMNPFMKRCQFYILTVRLFLLLVVPLTDCPFAFFFTPFIECCPLTFASLTAQFLYYSMHRFGHVSTYDVANLRVRICIEPYHLLHSVWWLSIQTPWPSIARDASTNATDHPKNSRFHECVIRKAAYCVRVLYRYHHNHAQPDVDSTVQADP